MGHQQLAQGQQIDAQMVYANAAHHQNARGALIDAQAEHASVEKTVHVRMMIPAIMVTVEVSSE